MYIIARTTAKIEGWPIAQDLTASTASKNPIMNRNQLPPAIWIHYAEGLKMPKSDIP